MDIVVLIGRIMFAFLFLTSAFGHFSQAKPMSQYARSRGVPAAEAAVVGGGVLLLLGAISVLLGIWADLGALLLVAFLIPTAVFMHAFWRETDAQARQQEMIQFNKDLALAGASLMLFGLFRLAGDDLGLMMTGPLF